MRSKAWALAMAALGGTGTGVAQAEPAIAPASLAPDAACVAAIEASEVRWHIPHGLLLAIAQVESGRPDARGALRPWPWTIDLGGQGRWFASRDEAIAFTAAALKRPGVSIDTGCMQVNLQQHPDAFGSLDAAFDPAENADYAGRFLSSLFHETGDWGMATGLYHSRDPALYLPYRVMVAFHYPALPAPPLASLPDKALGAAPRPRKLDPLAAAWGATLAPSLSSRPGAGALDPGGTLNQWTVVHPALARPAHVRNVKTRSTLSSRAG